ncbi:MAG: ATP-binding cassette domain-containing protein [Treponema sp.]|nr:ATP-binding cassette domain-containing protein [Treponema sp.]
MAVILEIDDVSFSAQNLKIVSDFSHQFEEGKTTALVGPSGSGKSTVLKLAAGILVPNAGEVIFRGQDINTMNRQENLAFRLEAAMVFQDSALWANQNLYQTLELPLRIHFPQMPKKEREAQIRSVVAEVGYKRDLYIRPSQLSMGEQKLIAFARATICRPNLLFLDEWTESLDESAAKRLMRLVANHQQENKSVIFVSHDFRIIRNMADYVIMIKDGSFFQKFSKQQLDEDKDLAQFVEKGIAL